MYTCQTSWFLFIEIVFYSKNYDKTYYYYTLKNDDITKIAISNDAYINRAKTAILTIIFPLVLGTCLFIGLMLVFWSTIIVRKIEKLKNKIDNIDNPTYLSIRESVLFVLIFLFVL